MDKKGDKMKGRKNGFTLIELLIALLIFKIILLIFFPQNKINWERRGEKGGYNKVKCQFTMVKDESHMFIKKNHRTVVFRFKK
ncbi:MAG: prepilin-type N-terminal cleavage/methylation domain-containing protein [Anaeromicrobium sp.]|jgi:prepilin-type N-terminal cleavage/methylation domain-containing protein|uniref:prepilin-type N-terminal cleavage/methylation domain-containing protein n=1 Tax=Anaeromicrobium sp. TaxID=1929132 RepID=UPI0025FF1A96|nr:prepilin-type N-terminal cleavage/methylation domain-containing protein [Anaeromicrobium sp.]MCT4595684.1 prepilin-type N-terminal cleavage/methylation domain-containing protein [Anaeromicrobium sp.]